MHKDDLNGLEDIKNYLGIRVRQYKDKFIFSVTNKELIYFFMNTTLIRLNTLIIFKRAYTKEEIRDFFITKIKKTFTNQILDLKNSMNTKRTNSVLPLDHQIVIKVDC